MQDCENRVSADRITQIPSPRLRGYRIHTSLPGGAALHYPNRLPSRKRGSPRPPSRGPASVCKFLADLTAIPMGLDRDSCGI